MRGRYINQQMIDQPCVLKFDSSRMVHIKIQGDDQLYTPIYFTGSEFEVLRLLAENVGRIITRDRICFNLYKGADSPELKIVDVLISKIRAKLFETCPKYSFIQTNWGKGYFIPDIVKADFSDTGNAVTVTIDDKTFQKLEFKAADKGLSVEECTIHALMAYLSGVY